MLVLKKSTILKLICRYKSLKAKNRNSFIKANILLLAINLAITCLLN